MSLEHSPGREKRGSTHALIPTRKVAERFGVCMRTVERWVQAGILPQPTRINGRNYHTDGVQPQRDTQAA